MYWFFICIQNNMILVCFVTANFKEKYFGHYIHNRIDIYEYSIISTSSNLTHTYYTYWQIDVKQTIDYKIIIIITSSLASVQQIFHVENNSSLYTNNSHLSTLYVHSINKYEAKR